MHRYYSGSGSALQRKNNGRPCVSKQFQIDNDLKNWLRLKHNSPVLQIRAPPAIGSGEAKIGTA